MNVKGKTKNNIMARMDIIFFYNRKNMELVFDGSRVTGHKVQSKLRLREEYKTTSLPIA